MSDNESELTKESQEAIQPETKDSKDEHSEEKLDEDTDEMLKSKHFHFLNLFVLILTLFSLSFQNLFKNF